jgi:serine protease Do
MKRIALALIFPFAAACGPDTAEPPASASAPPPAQAQPAPAATPPAPAEARAASVTEPGRTDASAGASRPSSLPDFATLMERQGPAVVNIITKRTAAGRFAQLPDDDALSEFFRRFIPDMPPRDAPGQGIGSGFIISEDGYILTNAHVVAEADEVTVRLAEAKRELPAKVIGADERTDIALLKVDAGGLPSMKLGRSENLRPGDWVAAIGSPFGFENTITAGIVSGKGRSLPAESFVPFIQTDVAVNPGNSGGPLLNLDGEVVGINSMIYSQTGGFMGVSFAIPIEVALDVTKQLREHGKVTRGRIGVRIQPLSRELAKSFGLDEPTGALVASVEPGGPADKAGLQSGDVVLEYNGEKVEDANALPRLVGATKPGERASITVWRAGKRETIKVVTAELPGETVAAAVQPPSGREGAQKANRLGLVVSELPPAQRRALGVEYGLLVERVEDPAARGQIRPGDVIVAVNRQRFRNLQEFEQLLRAQKKGDSVALLVQRGDATVFVPMEVG